MRTISQAVLAARKRVARDEGGYLLIYVLGVIGLTSVLVIALLGLALTSAKVAAMEAQEARENRAADGALEAQIADIASRGGDVCGGGAVAWPRTVQASGASDAVDVECGVSDVADDPEADLTGPDVQLVGSGGYEGEVAAPPGSFGAPTKLVVKGNGAPARFGANVLVAGGAAPTSGGSGPAVEVAGQYRQSASPGGGGCGLLGTPGVNQIVDGGGTGSPTCGATGLPGPISAVNVSTVPTVAHPMSCPGPVHLAPGRYTADDVQRLNQIVTGTAPCTIIFDPGANPEEIHYLDVFDPSRSGEAANTLIISNPNVRIIGGVDTTGPDGVARCDNSDVARGVQIVLSGRSAIRHQAGQVALCAERRDGTARPVLSQSASADTQPKFVSATVAGFSNESALAPGATNWSVSELCGGSRGWFSYQWGSWWWEVADAPNCGTPSFTTRWTSAGSGPLQKATVLMDMLQWPQLTKFSSWEDPGSHHFVDAGVQFSVNGPAGSCQTAVLPVGRSYAGTLAYDLLGNEAGSTCRSVLTDQRSLNGAAVTATFSRRSGSQGLRIDVRNVRLQTNDIVVTAAAAGTADPQWNNTQGNALAAGGASAVAAQEPANLDANYFPRGAVWEATAGVTRSFTLSNLTVPGGVSGDAHIDRLAVEVRGPQGEPSYLADPVDGGRFIAELVNSSGATVCATGDDLAARAYGQSNQTLRFDLIGAGNCGSLDRVGQLQGLGLKISYRTGCARTAWGGLVEAGTKCGSVPIPQVDVARVVVGTDTISDPPTSSVTVDKSSAVPSAHTAFDVYGAALLPATDLDVNWKGTGDLGERPIFDGPLQLHGLGIEQMGSQQGTVCCTAVNGGAVLEARVGGNLRAKAVIKVDPKLVGSPTAPRTVEVLSWKICGRSGCE